MPSFNRRSFLAAAGALAGATVAGAGFGRALAGPTNPVPVPPPLDPESGPMINAFAGDLYAKLKASKGNLFFSPFSISAALGMTATGAKGNTLTQMQNVLHLPKDSGTVDARFAGLIHALTNPNAGYQLSTANAIWAQKGFPWRPEFKARVGRYGAGLTDADFVTQPDAERLKVNAWVENQTKDKIKELLKSGMVTPDTRMVLANAIYFKGDWLEQFDKKATRPAPFTSTDGTKSDATLMFRKGKFSLYKDDDVQVLSLPYKGNDLSMLVALPTKVDGLPALESTLTPDVFTKWTKGMRETPDLQVFLPKFKVETEYSLGRTLIDMGMKDAFDGGNADFGGMHSGPERLSISLVVHKAYVDVNEEGTEAAAATGVVMMRLSAIPRPNVFRADHPFAFAILHNATGAVLFFGRIERP